MRNGTAVAYTLAGVMRVAGPVFLLPFIAAWLLDPRDLTVFGIPMPSTALLFLAAGTLVSAIGTAVRIALRPRRHVELTEKQSYLAVAGGWLLMSFACALPFLAVLSPIDAWFEAMSGVTATGATTFREIEAVPASIVFWRSLLQWLAGYAIIVIGIALLTRLTHAGAQLLAADVTAAGKRLRPRIPETARAMAPIYGGFSVLTFVGYFLTIFFTGVRPGFKASVMDALIHTFSTVSTGGFSNHTNSLAYFQSAWVEAVAVVAMLVAGTSFALIYYVRKDPRRIIEDREWRSMMLLLGVASLGAVGLLVLSGQPVWPSLRAGIVTVVSIATSTGLVIVDHDTWPTLARSLLLVTMFIGAMAGSTSGGLKVLRIALLLKVARRELRKLLHPRAIISVRHGGRGLPEDTLLTIIAFFFTYITTWMIGAVLLIGMEPHLGIFDGAAAAAAAIGNVGPAMGIVGPFDTYDDLHARSRVVLSLLMWIGRLEVFAALVFLSPSSWRS